MEKEKSNNKRLRLLEQTEHKQTRALYEEVFPEDGKRFVDYYYQYKTAANRIYVIENEAGEIVSMLQLNPYAVKIGQNTVQSEYIIAVATKEEYRHQGMMRKLISAALEDCRQQRMPFVYLMPAAEAIYYPFDFRFIYDRPQWQLSGVIQAAAGSLSCTPAGAHDLPSLSRWAEQELSVNWRTYPVHDEAYYRVLLAEQHCQGGEIVVIRDGGRICGCFFTAVEEGVEVREALIEEAYREEAFALISDYLKVYPEIKIYGGNLPAERHGYRQESKIMARVVHAAALLECLSAAVPVELAVYLSDPILADNTGQYLLKLDQDGCRVTMTADTDCQWRLSVAQLTELIFGRIGITDTDAPQTVREQWPAIRLPVPVMFNEIV